MRKLPWSEKIIDVVELKLEYLRWMEEFREARAKSTVRETYMFTSRRCTPTWEKLNLRRKKKTLNNMKKLSKNGRKNWGYGGNNWRSVKRNV
jgi:hypothetical protein